MAKKKVAKKTKVAAEVDESGPVITVQADDKQLELETQVVELSERIDTLEASLEASIAQLTALVPNEAPVVKRRFSINTNDVFMQCVSAAMGPIIGSMTPLTLKDPVHGANAVDRVLNLADMLHDAMVSRYVIEDDIED